MFSKEVAVRAAAFATITAMALAGNGAAQQLPVTVYRSWQPPDVTVVNGLFRVDGAMLGTGPACEYTVRLAVIDSAGTRLVNNEWDGRCPPPQNGLASGALETFEFGVLPAHYTVQVTVTPKSGGSPIRAEVPLASLPADAAASDLILARRAGWVDSTANVQWTIRKGQLGIAAASEVVAEEKQPQVAYYLEIYPTESDPMQGQLVGVIRRPDGMQLARMVLQRLQSAQQSQPLAGNVSLAGLAPGDYVLETRLELEDTTILRSHAFRMEGMLSQQARPQAPATTNDYFRSLSPEQLRELFDPVIVTLHRQSDRDLFQSLNAEGKRNFLYQYFGGVEPTAGGGGENPLDLYLQRAQYVNAQFGERQGGLEGWQTDRGRVWLQRGKPNSQVSRPLPRQGAAPFVIWSYQVPNYFYLFVDEARIGGYRLIYTNDPDEQSLPDWDTRVGEEAVEDLRRLGIPIRSGGSQSIELGIAY